MKKFAFIFAIIFIANMACKREFVSPACGCSPIPPPSLSLVIKNDAGTDLLNTANTGSYKYADIQLYTKDSNGNLKYLAFGIRPPFSFDKDSKFENYLLYSDEIGLLATSINTTFYLKLGTQTPIELNLQVNNNLRIVEKLLIDKKDAVKETGKVATYMPSIFYLKI